MDQAQPKPPIAPTLPVIPVLPTSKLKNYAVVWIVIGAVILTIGIGIGLVVGKYLPKPKQITSYEECVKANGNQITLVFPGTCTTRDGRQFTQPLTDEEKKNLQPPADPTANWKTYINKKYGYQIKYPSDWKSTETDDPGLGDGPLTYTVIVSDAVPLKDSGYVNIAVDRNLSWNQFTKNAAQQGFQDYKFNGLNAMIFKKDGYDTSINLNLPTDKLITTVTYGFSHDNSDKETIDQILSTFKFVEQATPKPTCRPRPACLDTTPRCMIAETSDMCPPNQKL